MTPNTKRTQRVRGVPSQTAALTSNRILPAAFNAAPSLGIWIFGSGFIQRSEHRDARAIHAKLDELLKTHPNASKKLTRIDDEEPEEIESYRGRETHKTMRSNTSCATRSIA